MDRRTGRPEVRTESPKPLLMKNNLLLPHRFQKVGWAIFIPAAALGLMILIDGYNGIPSYLYPESDNWLCRWLGSEGATRLVNNLAILGIVIGGLVAGCSKEKIEDEMISSLRLHSLLIALYVNYAFLIVCALLVYDIGFIDVMVWNMFTMLLIFLFVFRFKLWRMRKEARDEK